MPPSNHDFAHPVAKTAGCLALAIAPVACAFVHLNGTHPLPPLAFVGSVPLALTGVGMLCNRPSVVKAMILCLRDFLRARDQRN